MAVVLIAAVQCPRHSDPLIKARVWLEPMADGSACYTYHTAAGDTLDWIAAKLNIDLVGLVATTKM